MANPPLRVKICGHTTVEDLRLSAEAGADYLGIIVAVPWSPRSVNPDQAGELFAAAEAPAVLVTVDQPPERLLEWVARWRPAALQLHGHEPPRLVARLASAVQCEVWKALHRPPADAADAGVVSLEQIHEYEQAGVSALLIDTAIGRRPGGTGRTSDWSAARELVQAAAVPMLLAGGLTPENVAAAVAAVRPAGVDVGSGVEAAPGRKNPDKLRRFVAAARL